MYSRYEEPNVSEAKSKKPTAAKPKAKSAKPAAKPAAKPKPAKPAAVKKGKPPRDVVSRTYRYPRALIGAFQRKAKSSGQTTTAALWVLMEQAIGSKTPAA